jgi:5-(carboxyamino)imidazole ribonucleotide synthase
MKFLILGHGQLARMMALEGQAHGWDVLAVDVKHRCVVDPIRKVKVEGSLEYHVQASDVITAEFEHIPEDLVHQADETGKLFPRASSFLAAGNRLQERQMLERSEVPFAAYHVVEDRLSYDLAIETLGLPLVLKTVSDGYDGKGQFRLMSQEQVESVWASCSEAMLTSGALLAEQWIPFKRELSIIGVRSRSGEWKTYDLGENTHHKGILHLTEIKRVEPSTEQQAKAIFKAIAEELDYIGVLAIECFEQEDGSLLVNEIAPRVHNSGHWTQQGTLCNQFDHHLRAVAGLPLGDTETIHPTTMVNIIGVDQLPDAVEALPGTRVHWYGKTCLPGRKMGHINVSASSRDILCKTLSQLSSLLPSEDFFGCHQAHPSCLEL